MLIDAKDSEKKEFLFPSFFLQFIKENEYDLLTKHSFFLFFHKTNICKRFPPLLVVCVCVCVCVCVEAKKKQHYYRQLNKSH